VAFVSVGWDGVICVNVSGLFLGVPLGGLGRGSAC
jgi:hypothetical protein